MNPTAPTLSKLAYTVPQFCDGFNVSRTHFYGLLKEGRGPRLMKVGRRTLISAQAAADWCKRMEDETNLQSGYVCIDGHQAVA
ncbi:hypothetical protein CBP36_11960 [Acidovorax carolinensis]|uniref:Helix-turn-helix domain-containing protein n=1 Tax=Acidovorax carolinensis TaxID=553814 RepID=A0A240UEI8_9BURK|nr:helix-turn-helix domain-containing protein [Acidovorax carolinensis]ART54831.1 hypothetical protein CBP35_06960 [Acidovorax carolinensis]ART59459.1 hypothetical protein CBP36_11960 [Acidovorax carolinensis]